MKHLILLSMLIPAPLIAAGPQFATNCDVSKDIRVPSNSQGFFMSPDCKTAYVLPPTKGIQTITGRTNGNLDRCQEVRSLNKNLGELNKQITKGIKGKIDEAGLTQLLAQRKNLLTEYGDLANTVGASVEMNFDMAIEQNLQSFRNYNDGLGVNFVPVSLKQIQLGWNQKSDLDPDMRIAFNQMVPVADANNIGSGSFSARLDLSLFGACPLMDPFTKEMPKKIRVNDLAGLITPNVTYKYEIGAKYTYIARYNRGALAKKIRESSSSGGFFKTSTSASLINTAESTGWFSLEMTCDDSRVCEQAKIETAAQIKERLMQEVLDGIALARFGYPLPPAESGTPGKNGASTAADGLRQCSHAYCQAGAIVLDVLSSTLGSTSKTDSYIATNDHIAEEKVDVSTPVSFTGTMGFTK